MRHTVHTRSLHRAAKVLGGSEALARYLGVPEVQLGYWLDGITDPSAATFLKVVDLLMAVNPRPSPGSAQGENPSG